MNIKVYQTKSNLKTLQINSCLPPNVPVSLDEILKIPTVMFSLNFHIPKFTHAVSLLALEMLNDS